MNTDARPKPLPSQIIYGEIVYWITVVACLVCMVGPVIALADPTNNVSNPYKLFDAIFAGKSAAEVWRAAGSEFPGGHFYLQHFAKGDGFTQLGLALGCSVGLWGLLATAVAFLKEKAPLYTVLALWVSLLIALSMIGIVSGAH